MIPKEIESIAGREIRIVWEDDVISLFKNADLRFTCRCASCVEEITGQRIITREQIPETIAPNNIELVGNYAIQITWSDGHASGIYTFEHLRQLGSVE